jgi:hypothetical protein
MEKTTVIFNVKRPTGEYVRDARTVDLSEIVYTINAYLSCGCEIVALEEIDGDIADFYDRTLTDDDIDRMAADVPE